VLLAFAIAYEVQLRLCDHAGEPNIWERGWHHGTNMQFASAALAARLLGLDAVGVANAIAIAGSHNNTLAQSQRGNIPMMKASAEATIAKGGVEAALMAMNGLTGPEEIFEGGVGWRHAVAGEVDFAALVRPVDGHYRIMARITASTSPRSAPSRPDFTNTPSRNRPGTPRSSCPRTARRPTTAFPIASPSP
jgi:2-methylcitrate dehydratase